MRKGWHGKGGCRHSMMAHQSSCLQSQLLLLTTQCCHSQLNHRRINHHIIITTPGGIWEGELLQWMLSVLRSGCIYGCSGSRNHASALPAHTCAAAEPA